MFKLLTAPISALLFCSVALACEPSIEGTWKSNGEKTMAFAHKNVKLEPRQEAFLSALMGHMTMKFDNGLVSLNFPDLKVPVKGELKPFVGFEQKNSYKVIFCNSRMAVVHSVEENGREDVATYFFVGPDEMWAYAGGNDPAVPDIHLREYFSRIQ